MCWWLAVVDAKRWDLPYTEGLAQAKTYASKLRARFAYATNGQRIYGVDMQSGGEGDVEAYPSPDELWNLTFAEVNDWRERFAAVPFEDKGRHVGFALLPGQRDQRCAGSDCR
jgi:type I restriction enzyme R subunit